MRVIKFKGRGEEEGKERWKKIMKGRRHDRLEEHGKKRGIVRIVTARSMPLWASYRIPRRNASQHPNKQQQSSPLFCRWTYHDHLSFSPPPPSLLFLLLLIPLLTHMAVDLYLLPIKRAELDRFGWEKYMKKNPCVDRGLKAREKFFQLEAVLAL